MRQILILSIYITLTLNSATIAGQEQDPILKGITDALSQSDCDKAEKLYKAWKESGGSDDSSLVHEIAECKDEGNTINTKSIQSKGRVYTYSSKQYFFDGKKNISNIRSWGLEAIEYLKNNPNAKLKLTGYAAFKGNGSISKINMRLAKKRVKGAAKILKETYGIKEEHLLIEFKNDEMYPFTNTDVNGAVSITSYYGN